MFKWLRRKSDNRLGSLVEFVKLANASWTKKDYRSLANEGYEKNVIAYYCINKISKAAADIPIFVKINDKEVEKNPVIDLLKRPNPKQSYQTFIRELIMHRLISGNSYVYGNVTTTKRIMELTLMRPDRVRIETNVYQEPYEYIYTIGCRQYRYEIEPITLLSKVLHIKEPNPLCDLYGLSPISAAAMGIDQHNESSEWNKKLLENSARPPGVLTLKDKSDGGQTLTDKQKMDLRDEINEKFAGYRNAGKIPILTFDMEWRSMGMSPTDMDWINGKNSTSRDICLAFGVPPFLLGMAEGATFNNVSEAKLALYEETVVPLIQSILADLSHFLSEHQKQNIEIVPDLDQVSALAPRREMARNNARQDVIAGLITINEARAEIGYDEVQGGDEILVPAGKLPLDFDVAAMTPQKFNRWLLSEGFSKETSQELVKIAYTSRINS